MVKPTDVLWELERHTLAKHKILRRYLEAWMPIMASRNERLCLIDGFAGPGRYIKGEPGSPMIMLDVLLSHAARQRIESQSRVGFIFIEKNAKRCDWLRTEVDAVKGLLPTTWKPPLVINRDFGDVIGGLLDALPRGGRPVPTFLFIDPFGYKETRPELSARILGYPKCEVLIFLPLHFIARFLDQPALAETFNNLFKPFDWEEAIKIQDLEARKRYLHNVFMTVLFQSAKFVRSFEIRTDTNSSYHLFFASNNLRGLEKMKEAMWVVDRVAGTSYSDSTAPGQEVMFGDAADLGVLEEFLRAEFVQRWFSIEEAMTFTMLYTPFLYSHLKTGTLKPLEAAGRLALQRTGPKRLGSYPAGTRIRLLA